MYVYVYSKLKKRTEQQIKNSRKIKKTAKNNIKKFKTNLEKMEKII